MTDKLNASDRANGDSQKQLDFVHWPEFLRSTVLTLWALYFLGLIISGNIKYYINPIYTALPLAGAIVLTAMVWVRRRRTHAQGAAMCYASTMLLPDGRVRKRRESSNEPGQAHELTFSCYRRMPLLSKDRTRQWLVDALDELEDVGMVDP